MFPLNCIAFSSNCLVIPSNRFTFPFHNYAFHGAAQNAMEGLPNQGPLGGFEMGVPNIKSPMGNDYQADLDSLTEENPESAESMEEEGSEI